MSEQNHLHKANDVRHQMQDHFIRYASYVILDRAIPDVIDGLKPVQRRILHTLWNIDDGKLHKVANVAGQTMAFHPHGDAAITDALVNLANKGYLLDMQGNFGNIFTGDSAAAARYIETRLSPLARTTLFNPALTQFVPSYDGRHQEPVRLPSKIPLLLTQGASGIAVGMATNVLPHNFIELLRAEIAILEGKDYTVLPDFLTGGVMDASEYQNGKGKVKLRAKIDIVDPKTLVISEICHGTTTESLIRSIDEAAKKGKIKIDSIYDYTSSKVEIEIKLPRGQYAEKMMEALFAYTDCEVMVNSQIVVIRDNLPCEMTVNGILELHVSKLKEYLKKELEIERDRLLEKIFDKTLERIFIENRLYKKIEEVKSYDKVHETVEKSLVPFHKQLMRVPTSDDREKLLSIPIRRISRFDLDKNQEEIAQAHKNLAGVEKDLKNIKRITIRYLKDMIKKYGSTFPRRTKITEIEDLDRRAIETRQLQIGFNPATGFIGTQVKDGSHFECTNYDKLLVMYDDGTYQIINIPEKYYTHQEGRKAVYMGVADKKTVMSVVYKDPKTSLCYAKRFVVQKFILERTYRFMEAGMKLEFLSTDPRPIIELRFIPKVKQRIGKIAFDFDHVLKKGANAKGVRMSNRSVKKVIVKANETARR